ncbi:MAG: SGNH/GDSL hydrolase family protein [Lentisphaeraceae bacterium]|nr:SGNH/GDSL hydrolase family protein [Lentisphaeraceae bacterium]
MKFLLILIFSSYLGLQAGQKISADDKRLSLSGANYSFVDNGILIPQRHSSEILKMNKKQLAFDPIKAQTTSGVVLKFKTSSQSIALNFKALQGENRGSEFAIFESGKLTFEKKFSKSTQNFQLEYKRQNKNLVDIEVVFPSWSKIGFAGMQIDKEATLEKSVAKNIYVAFGDSISHGTGQGSATYKTWPFLLSRKLNTDLYNLAVGGGKVSIPAAGLLNDLPEVKIITLLIGYNDLNTGISPNEFAGQYRKFLEVTVKAQPLADIYCISPLYTKTKKSKNSDYTIDEFRQAVTQTVKAFQKSNNQVKLIIGHEISSEKNLRENSKDPVHLGIPGARMLADELSKIIKN